MTTKWTKGPWKAQLTEGWGWVVLAGKTFVAFKLRSEANAQLIASAPMLYEAAEAAETILILLKTEVAALGFRSSNVLPNLQAALGSARGEK